MSEIMNVYLILFVCLYFNWVGYLYWHHVYAQYCTVNTLLDTIVKYCYLHCSQQHLSINSYL